MEMTSKGNVPKMPALLTFLRREDVLFRIYGNPSEAG
jgi:hypothetical protein